jgi:hypothetical protein
MDVNGSPEYALTWKEWDMPAGLPICALRASARRTPANACSGWPTPATNDSGCSESARQGGENLAVIANLTGWPTPVAEEARQGFQTRNNGKKGSQKSLTTVDVESLAGWPTPKVSETSGVGESPEAKTKRGANAGLDLAWAAQISGPMPPSSNAATEKPAVLNPDHSRWLMGYPAAWGSCGATAMQSSRKSPRSSSKPS